jgi:hypothetical protein
VNSTFKVGDTIKCIDNNHYSKGEDLVLGKNYIISQVVTRRVTKSKIRVVLILTDPDTSKELTQWWGSSRFELVPTK